MPTITVTITLDVPEGTQVSVADIQPLPAPDTSRSGVPADVLEQIERFVPTRFREFTKRYVAACVEELSCSVEQPPGDRHNEYLNIFPPPHCKRARVAGLTYSSTRTALYTGAIELDDYKIAEKTFNSGVYAHPKLAHLDSDAAVDEAIDLTRRAIARVER